VDLELCQDPAVESDCNTCSRELGITFPVPVETSSRMLYHAHTPATTNSSRLINTMLLAPV